MKFSPHTYSKFEKKVFKYLFILLKLIIESMRRGRPNIRTIIQSNLLSVLGSSQTPMTISGLTRLISKETSRQISWNTIQKYVEELIKIDKVQAITLPHSKQEDKDGRTVYMIKK